MKRFHSAAAVAFVLFASVARAEDQKILRVGIAPTSPPIQYWDKNTPAGLEVDFANKLGEELNRKIEFVDLNFAKLIPSLLNNDIDIIMAGMSVTKIRSFQVAFATPYLKIGQMPLVRLEDKNKYILPMDLIMTDKNIGATENTTSEYLLVQEFPKAKKSLYPTQADAVNALKKKRIDILVLDSPYVLWLASENEGKLVPVPLTLTEEELAWGVRKSDKELLDSLDVILQKWKETGQLNAMIKKRIPGFN